MSRLLHGILCFVLSRTTTPLRVTGLYYYYIFTQIFNVEWLTKTYKIKSLHRKISLTCCVWSIKERLVLSIHIKLVDAEDCSNSQTVFSKIWNWKSKIKSSFFNIEFWVVLANYLQKRGSNFRHVRPITLILTSRDFNIRKKNDIPLNTWATLHAELYQAKLPLTFFAKSSLKVKRGFKLSVSNQ